MVLWDWDGEGGAVVEYGFRNGVGEWNFGVEKKS